MAYKNKLMEERFYNPRQNKGEKHRKLIKRGFYLKSLDF